MSEQQAQPGGTSEIAQKLRAVAVDIRADIAVSRHLFQGVPAYVVRDPVTFASHRFEAHDYEVLVRIDRSETLGEAFQSLVEDETLEESDEEDFYAFVLHLHRCTLLNLPFSDHAALYKRYERKKKSKRTAQILSPFFLRVPLWNPDPFLDRTHRFVDWLFTRWAFLGWMILMAGAIGTAWSHREGLAAPLLTALEFENLPLLWVVLIVLKLIHEFGHAYACKRFGGQVPDMGAFFIVGTPAAYVDASSAWGFHDIRQRMVVNLGGMYFESICAAIGIFVWAATPPGMLNSIAYQVAFMASIVTIGFNINPLAKFDGYYMLADLVGIPNLRQRASEQLNRMFNRVALGLEQPDSEFGVLTQIGLAAYGFLAAFYRITVLLGLSVVIATKTFMLGLALAAFFIVSTLAQMSLKAARYLWLAEETQPVRKRAIAVSVGTLLAACLALFAVPSGQSVDVTGFLARENERVLHAPGDGFVQQTPPLPGVRPAPGKPAIILDDPEADLAAQEAAAQVNLARLELANPNATPGESAVAGTRLRHAISVQEQAGRRARELEVSIGTNEDILSHARPLERGTLIARGEPMFRVGSGGWAVKALADPDAVAATKADVGDRVQCRTLADPSQPIWGRIISIAAVADRQVPEESLTNIGGGAITVDPATGQAAQPFVEIVIQLDEPPTGGLVRGATAIVRLEADPEPLAFALARNVRKFAADLSTR